MTMKPAGSFVCTRNRAADTSTKPRAMSSAVISRKAGSSRTCQRICGATRAPTTSCPEADSPLSVDPERRTTMRKDKASDRVRMTDSQRNGQTNARNGLSRFIRTAYAILGERGDVQKHEDRLKSGQWSRRRIARWRAFSGLRFRAPTRRTAPEADGGRSMPPERGALASARSEPHHPARRASSPSSPAR